MMSFMRMLWFHTHLFSRNSYFSQLLISSTLSILVLQMLVANEVVGSDTSTIWIRSAVVGMWTVCTVAAGLVGYQRFQGTLVYLVMTPSSPARTLLPLIASAATFGVLAFPLAALGGMLFGNFPDISSWPTLLVGVAALWLSCLAVTTLVASVFVLTPNAITYEGLLAVPFVLLSGVFGVPENLWIGADYFRYILPTTPAVRILLEQPQREDLAPLLLLCLGVVVVWFYLSHNAMNAALDRARFKGSLEVV